MNQLQRRVERLENQRGGTARIMVDRILLVPPLSDGQRLDPPEPAVPVTGNTVELWAWSDDGWKRGA